MSPVKVRSPSAPPDPGQQLGVKTFTFLTQGHDKDVVQELPILTGRTAPSLINYYDLWQL